ncbi:MAG: sulfotransferase domain-containing protein [Nocardioidaceae bacterium]
MAQRSLVKIATLRRPTRQDIHRLLRRPTSRWRTLPDFLIIGAQKAGTTSLYHYLQISPDIRAALVKEVHFFDHNYERGVNWYRAHFPLAETKRSWVTGESSPYYLLHPAVPVLAHEMLPDARLIAMLRHPVDRAYSHFHHSRAYGAESESDFATALDRETERTDAAWAKLQRGGNQDDRLQWFSYARRSHYAPQIARWLRLYPREALLILTTEELEANPSRVLRRALLHLGLPGSVTMPQFAARNARPYDRMPAALRESLLERFAHDVAEVERLIGRSTGWR